MFIWNYYKLETEVMVLKGYIDFYNTHKELQKAINTIGK